MQMLGRCCWAGRRVYAVLRQYEIEDLEALEILEGADCIRLFGLEVSPGSRHLPDVFGKFGKEGSNSFASIDMENVSPEYVRRFFVDLSA